LEGIDLHHGCQEKFDSKPGMTSKDNQPNAVIWKWWWMTTCFFAGSSMFPTVG
jgi:hypothetical protein